MKKVENVKTKSDENMEKSTVANKMFQDKYIKYNKLKKLRWSSIEIEIGSLGGKIFNIKNKNESKNKCEVKSKIKLED